VSGVATRARRGALAMAAALAGCAPSGRERLVVAVIPQPAISLLFAAKEGGCLDREGLELVERQFDTGRDALAALLAREVEAATCFETPIVLRAASAPDLRVLTTLHTSSRNTVVVARGDRGIRQAKDLRGRLIGVPLRTNAEVFLRVLLASEGVAEAEVRMVEVAPDRAAPALAGGEVDAVAIWGPLSDLARLALPEGAAVELRSPVYSEWSVLATRADVLAARASALRKLLRCLAVEEGRAAADPARVMRLAGRALPGSPPEVLRANLARVTLQLGLSRALLSALEQEAAWLRTKGGLDAPLADFNRVLAPEILSEVAPEAVTIPSRI
jgi:ABC-type nitrate/sulfonate/bicarbonate transport system substrate-binding protein